MFEKVHHLTSARNWEKIQNSGFLKPMTKFDNNGRTTKVGKKLNNRLFLACVFAGDFKIWEEYDLLKDLEGTVVKGMPNRIVERDEIVLLEIPILNSEGVFVRERLCTTQRYGNAILPGAINNYDDMMNSFGLNMANKGEIDFVRELWKKYDESSVPLNKYRGQYEVPEVWLPQETPVKNVERLYY